MAACSAGRSKTARQDGSGAYIVARDEEIYVAGIRSVEPRQDGKN